MDPITKAQLARIERVSRQMVGKWVARGMPTLPDGRLDRETARDWIGENTRRHVERAEAIRLTAIGAVSLAAIAAAVGAMQAGADRAATERAGDQVLIDAWAWLEELHGPFTLPDDIADRWRRWIVWDRVTPINFETAKEASSHG